MLLSSKNEEDDSGLDQSCARFDEEKVAVGGVAKEARLCFLDDGMEWADMRLGGELNVASQSQENICKTLKKKYIYIFLSR